MTKFEVLVVTFLILILRRLHGNATPYEEGKAIEAATRLMKEHSE